MSVSYTAEYPFGLSVDSSIVTFFETFYRISDTKGFDENYLSQFTFDATLKLASISTKGHDQIARLRQASWHGVEGWIHRIHKIFPFGLGSTEFMLYGTVNITRAAGVIHKDWAAHAILENEEGLWKLKFYQVYLDADKH